ncbi:MAG: flap endonuclease-1 [Candidatus Woesearchaeota archaeon]
MGSKINELFEGNKIKIDDLRGKTLVVDSYNQLYMFLSSIRGADGSYLTDSKGNVTSHLSGLFSRFTNLMKHDIKFIFVFDGKPPELKMRERERRAQIKKEAELKFEIAKKEGDKEEMKKYAQRTSKLSKEMINDAKELIRAMGFPIVQAPSEGEAQAAHIVKSGKAYGILSQDADSLAFGSPVLVKNLTISQRRKRHGAYSYEEIEPEILELYDTLNTLGIDQDQLIILSILTGTDYNYGGIKGIGPKTALKLVKQHGKNFEALFKEVKWEESFDISWKEIFDFIKNCPITEDYDLDFSYIDKEKIIKILVEEHDFSRERIEKTLNELTKNKQREQSLKNWL